MFPSALAEVAAKSAEACRQFYIIAVITIARNNKNSPKATKREVL